MRLRSSLGTLMQFFLVAGFLLEYIVGPNTSYLTLAIVSLATPVICFGMFMWMPDSPQSLLVRPGGEQKAMESLRWLRGNPQESVLIKELDEIKVNNRWLLRERCIYCFFVCFKHVSFPPITSCIFLGGNGRTNDGAAIRIRRTHVV